MLQLNNLEKTKRQISFPNETKETPPQIVSPDNFYKTFNSKRGKASEHIVPFVLKIFQLNETDLSRAVAASIYKLDNLAIKIDSLIDLPKTYKIQSYSILDFKDLETEIIDCLLPLREYAGFEKLVNSTLDYVNISFKYNTSERHIIYDLNEGTDFSSCTTYYLYPLIKYLIETENIQISPKRIFLLIANYVQLLDDTNDVFEDIRAGIKTPISSMLVKKENSFIDYESPLPPFLQLINDVKRKTNEITQAITQAINDLNGEQYCSEIMAEWNNFQYLLNLFPVPFRNNRKEQLEYLKNIKYITPPMLCYIG